MSIVSNISEEKLNLMIDNYVNALDIDGYSIDELENDPIFMMRVILKTNDKNMFYLCSDELSKNLNFIKFMVEKFKANKDFIDEIILHYYVVCDEKEKLNYDVLKYFLENVSDKTLIYDETIYFLTNSNDEVGTLELAINLSNDVDNFSEAVIIANSKIIAKLVEFEVAKKEVSDEG